MPNEILLISIKPKYAEQIFNGKKTVELRRVKTRLTTGDLVLVYVTSPQQALMGYFTVEKVVLVENLQDNLQKFWHQVEDSAGLEYTEFKNYYQGASTGVGIFIKKFYRFKSLIELQTLKQEFPNFHPPQSYHYLNTEKTTIVEAIAGCKLL